MKIIVEFEDKGKLIIFSEDQKGHGKTLVESKNVSLVEFKDALIFIGNIAQTIGA